MISSLIDCVLLGALAFTGWRTTTMCRELRQLRRGETELSTALKEADASINRAAHAVVMLRSEGIEILAALDERIAAAREIAGDLEDRINVADRRLAVANDVAAPAPAPARAEAAAGGPQDTWLSLIESRLASASAANR
ncbi:hypothetical protein GCM10011390_49050 [Aureimonas endophytica]|uniref:Uncharacterized protein n=1 Tax=Aureimonas endophytica TaxID=2027858 RepID=A0A917EDY0_9HYPH|nr:hypothetical protein [Aureimonas endophytica]GGE23858.1 hypothetical protein GCM10011390_49050 [Aureimonas endophytica]